MVAHDRVTLETFVELADSLVSNYDVNEFLETLVERCGKIFQVTTAGVMVENPEGRLQLAAALTPEMEQLEQAELDSEEGPCWEAYRTGEPVVANDLANSDVAERWPTVIEQMRDMGLCSVYAFPLRVRDDRIGALNLYREESGAFGDEDVRLAQAFADVAAVGILQERKVTSAERRAVQLQTALDSRVVIEQAKGIISAERDMPVDQAFEFLRRHARSTNRKVHDVARMVTDQGARALESWGQGDRR